MGLEDLEESAKPVGLEDLEELASKSSSLSVGPHGWMALNKKLKGKEKQHIAKKKPAQHIAKEQIIEDCVPPVKSWKTFLKRQHSAVWHDVRKRSLAAGETDEAARAKARDVAAEVTQRLKSQKLAGSFEDFV